MATLYVLRHAKSDWGDPGVPDHDRPLAPRGVRAAEKLAAHLRASRIEPGLVLCSPATRAQETLVRVADGFEADVRVETEAALYLASAPDLLRRVRLVPDHVESVLLVGHNPGLHDLVASVSGAPVASFPTGAFATITLEGAWSGLEAGGGRLESLVVPREL